MAEARATSSFILRQTGGLCVFAPSAASSLKPWSTVFSKILLAFCLIGPLLPLLLDHLEELAVHLSGVGTPLNHVLLDPVQAGTLFFDFVRCLLH